MIKILLLRNGLMTILAAWVVLGVNVASAKPFAYVSNFDSSTVSVIDTATNAVVTTVGVGANPHNIAITPDGSHAYVSHGSASSSTVSVINTASNTVVTTVGVGVYPLGVAITPDGSSAYVANQNSDSVSVIDTASNTVVTTVGVGINPHGIAITPDGSRAYVGRWSPNTVSVIDTATNAVVATVLGVGSSCTDIAITPDSSRAYVVNYNSHNVSVINTVSNTVVATVGVGQNPVGVAITPDGSRAYVSNYNSNSVSVIDTATNAVVTTVESCQSPHYVAITPDGSRVYVTNRHSSHISVIDTTSNTIVRTVGVGGGPVGVAITPNTKPIANAGGNKSVLVGDTVELDGTGSTDADGDPLTFNWSFVLKPAESTATLSGATTPTASFVADVNGTYDVNLTVNDGIIDSDPDSANILAITVLNAMTQILNDAMDAINNIPPADFKNPKQANALTKKINAVLKMIEKEQYQGALDKLTNDILAKTDGCANGGEPDDNDWIRTCAEQDAVYSLLIEAINIVKSQI